MLWYESHNYWVTHRREPHLMRRSDRATWVVLEELVEEAIGLAGSRKQSTENVEAFAVLDGRVRCTRAGCRAAGAHFSPGVLGEAVLPEFVEALEKVCRHMEKPLRAENFIIRK